jgi:hypothetical protein
MIRLDSCHIEVNSESLNYLHKDSFTHKPQYRNGNIISDCYELKTPMPGIKSILFDNIHQSLKLQFSAKVLNDDYFQGINKNTIHNAIDNINQIGIIDIDVNKLIDGGIFHNIDSTNNVNMGMYDLPNEWKGICSSLAIAKNNSLFDVHTYNRFNNKGIVYKGNQTSQKNRLIIYDKFTELNTTKNKDFLNSCKNPLIMLNSAKNILRVESNQTSHKAIKDRFLTTSTIVNEVLNSSAMPNIYMLDKITQPHHTNQMQLIFDRFEPGKHKFDDIAYNMGIENLIRLFNYDEIQLKQFVLCFESSKNYEHIWYGRGKKMGIKKKISQMKLSDQPNNPQNNPILDHIRQSIMNDYAIAI